MSRQTEIPDHKLTRFGRFTRANKVKVLRVAVRAGISRGYARALAIGRSEPTRRIMVAIPEAMCYVVRRRVEVGELFDLELQSPPVRLLVALALVRGSEDADLLRDVLPRLSGVGTDDEQPARLEDLRANRIGNGSVELEVLHVSADTKALLHHRDAHETRGTSSTHPRR